MKKKIASFALALFLVLSLPMAACASVSSSSIGTSRISNTSGSVSAYALFNRTASTAKCTITLQVKSNGSWVAATNLPTWSYTKIVYNKNSISSQKTFTLAKGKVYRAKIVFQDTKGSSTTYKTRYTGSF